MTLDIVEEARSWVGTPFAYQASVKGVGTDCLGLVRGIWQLSTGREPEPLPAYTPDWGEVGSQELLLAGATRWLIPTEHEAAGDVLLFRMRPGAVAKHLGIQANIGLEPTFIHAYDRHGVVESALTGPWRAKIAGRFCFPFE